MIVEHFCMFAANVWLKYCRYDQIKSINLYVLSTFYKQFFMIRSIYGDYELEPVKKYETPYGMKYVWNMLTDKTKLIVHLKDKQKIRHRKRWSQVQ